MLLGLFHLRDNDQTSNGQLSLELYTYIRCSTEGLNLGKKKQTISNRISLLFFV